MSGCDSFYDTDDQCSSSGGNEHYCVHPYGHDGNHECDCGLDWLP